MDTKMIGDKIAKARKETNMSQAELARLLFISPQAVGKWERGASIPDIITFSRLAEILHVDLNYFSENFPSASNENVFNISEAKTEKEQIDIPERPLLTNFHGNNLTESDLEGVVAHNRKFSGSAVRGSNFTNADLTGSSFISCDIRDANFDGANLTDCKLSTVDLTNASFNRTILMRTQFDKSILTGAKFTDIEMLDSRLTMLDLRQTDLQNCVFNGVDFEYSDLRGMSLDGQTFIGVKFQKAALNDVSFNGATLKNVSFQPSYALTNKYYRAIKTIRFDGAMMDKLTYAALKGLEANLSNVTII
ncbi:pentapeptide repeat-containing protein [Taibaiella soli]|uniref:Cro/Cl family transcriptional regulator n=1 Tax=Taibaiella soli TaxID=1649169 RepID=A0A2W2AF88_9BACT|nr:pentapeptide repeat-containing protein [Taibaiella soli]PZF70830.1 Cro/Cl family transcriptional regulator [Taibaiella soli]